MKKYILAVISLLILVACSSINDGDSYSDSYETLSIEESEASIMEDLSGDYDPDIQDHEAEDQASKERMLVEDYTLLSETKDYDDAINKINALIGKYEGYTTSLIKYDIAPRTLVATIKIPRDRAEDFINELESLETLSVYNKSKTSTDVTDTYKDNEIRLDVLENKLDRLMALQEEQGSLDELLKVEAEIYDTTYEIETIKNSQRNLDTLISYSQIELTLDEIALYHDRDDLEVSFMNKLYVAVRDSGQGFINTVQDLIISLIYLLPYLIILVIIIGLVVYIVRRYNAKVKNKYEERLEKYNEKDQDMDKNDIE